MYFVYVLYSEKLNKTYVGCTSNLAQRLKYHNKGRVKSTKNGVPWKIIYIEKVSSHKEARERERWFKTIAGRRKLKQIFKNHQ